MEWAAILVALLAAYVLGVHVGGSYREKSGMSELEDESDIFDRPTPITAPAPASDASARLGLEIAPNPPRRFMNFETPTDKLDADAIREIVHAADCVDTPKSSEPE